MHTLPNLPDTAAREVYASLHKFLPPPSPDTAETRAVRDDEAMEAVAALHPTDAVDARFAADIVILEATGRDGLLLANDHHADIATVIRCRAQAASSFRQMRTLLREYRSMQAERDKALDAMHPAAMGRAGYWFYGGLSDFKMLACHNRTVPGPGHGYGKSYEVGDLRAAHRQPRRASLS